MQNDQLDRQIQWVRRNYDCIRTEPRYMAQEFYTIIMQLAQEREAILERLAAHERNKGKDDGYNND